MEKPKTRRARLRRPPSTPALAVWPAFAVAHGGAPMPSPARYRGRIMTVLIAGGGIGGLTLALSLHQIGIPVKVFESVSELKPLGVGINVLPHAVRELIELGLLDRLDASGVRTRELAYFSKHGKPIWSEPRGIEAGYKWPQFSIHRGTLQQILLDAATERLGADNILTNHHLRSGASRAASRPATNGRSSRSIAARCSRSCSTPRPNGWARTTFSPTTISAAGQKHQV